MLQPPTQAFQRSVWQSEARVGYPTPTCCSTWSWGWSYSTGAPALQAAVHSVSAPGPSHAAAGEFGVRGSELLATPTSHSLSPSTPPTLYLAMLLSKLGIPAQGLVLSQDEAAIRQQAIRSLWRHIYVPSLTAERPSPQ